jgi:peptide deformylase
MIRDILRMGDPRLLERSREVASVPSDGLAALLADMRDTMRAADGAGLAAPQIGVPLRVLSVPGFRGLVPRFMRLRYEGLTPEGERIAREVDGFHARVVQHECDHLDGILYPQRIRDMRKFGFTDILFPDLDAQDD